MITHKQCQMCNLTKPVSKFHKSKSTKDGYFSYCSPCKMEANKRSDLKRMSENRDKFLKQRTSWHIKKCYGLTLEQYDSMLADQQGVCAICGLHPSDTDFHRYLVVDHDHRCCPDSKCCGDCVRGLLCQQCNKGIGLLGDNPELIQKAHSYVSNWY